MKRCQHQVAEIWGWQKCKKCGKNVRISIIGHLVYCVSVVVFTLCLVQHVLNWIEMILSSFINSYLVTWCLRLSIGVALIVCFCRLLARILPLYQEK